MWQGGSLGRIVIFFALFAIGAWGVGLASAAGAAPVTYRIGSVAVEAQTTNPGLVLFTDESVLETTPFQLGDGESTTVDLFRVGTFERSVHPNDLLEKDIRLDLALARPDGTGGVSGTSRGKWRIFADDLGRVRWDGPVEIDTGVSRVELALSDARFGTPGSTTVRGTFTQLGSVPEPGSALLLGLGLGALALRRRSGASRGSEA